MEYSLSIKILSTNSIKGIVKPAPTAIINVGTKAFRITSQSKSRKLNLLLINFGTTSSFLMLNTVMVHKKPNNEIICKISFSSNNSGFQFLNPKIMLPLKIPATLHVE